MKASQIINQLKATLPHYTSYFSDEIAVFSMTRSGTTVTVITTSAHGLATLDRVNIVGALTPVSITTLTSTGDIASAETATDHDLNLESFDQNVLISGANQSEYNGSHKLIDVPNRNNFTYEISGSPASPATGTIFLQSSILFQGYNGLKTITVVDSITFTFTTDQTPLSPAQGTIIAKSETRVTGAITIERATRAYTQFATSKSYAFVVLNDVTASKNRNVLNDATDVYHVGIDYLQRLITQFSIYVFTPTVNSIAARDTRDQMSDVAKFLIKSIVGVKFDTEFVSAQSWGATFVNHSFNEYNGSFYIHQFNFENLEDVIFGDIVEPAQTRAFRDIEMAIRPFNENSDPANANIDLDREPL